MATRYKARRLVTFEPAASDFALRPVVTCSSWAVMNHTSGAAPISAATTTTVRYLRSRTTSHATPAAIASHAPLENVRASVGRMTAIMQRAATRRHPRCRVSHRVNGSVVASMYARSLGSPFRSGEQRRAVGEIS